MKREFLQLAHARNPQRDYVGGWYMSEKLDGYRCFWDGGLTRGLRAAEVPWANTAKHGRLIQEPMATGLWTRLGQPIPAPDYWLDSLPLQPLDGELTMGRGTFQEVASAVRTTTFSHPDWINIKYMVFDSPPIKAVFADGSINATHYKKKFSGIVDWCYARGAGKFCDFFEKPYYSVYATLCNESAFGIAKDNDRVKILEQKILPSRSALAEAMLERALGEIEFLGGEGIMVRNSLSFWKPERVHSLLKVKKLQDAEGIVLGYKWAKPTDLEKSMTGERTDKLLGKMGSLRVRLLTGKVFDLSGFTDAERRLFSPSMTEEEILQLGATQPGLMVPEHIYNPTFPIGSTVTFRYRELTTDGFPKEARFWRKRDDA